MVPGYEREQALLREKRENLPQEINRSEEIFNDVEKFLPIIWKYTDIQELNVHILNELIEKIVVHEKTVNPDGSKSQRVDIHYKFIGYIDTEEMLANKRIFIPIAKDAAAEDLVDNKEVIDKLINEVSKLIKITKKAIEYYTLHGLVVPSVLENGYRSYTNQDVEKLTKISVLRKLDISTEKIQHILNDTTNSALQAVSVKKN